ncbi:SIS domain-containing protein [Candidatus Woesearchaeota archaeon]|nr:SIS domain-containing protein [Candidatus Woesearchaeota archaeon]
MQPILPLFELPEVLQLFTKDKRFFIIGNGGSAKNAEHFASDMRELGYDADALCDSGNLTAIGNDFGYENTFAKQLMTKKLNNWILVALSGSGNSKNILEAVSWAKQNKGIVITLTSGLQGKLRSEGQYNILIQSTDMEDIETTTLYIMHYIKKELKKAKNNPS